MNAMPWWVELIVGALMITGGIFAVVSAWGLVRLKDFFSRMHAPALASTISAWAMAASSVVYFSVLQDSLYLHAWLIPVLLSITVPITTALLARAGVFRAREAGRTDVPPSLNAPPPQQASTEPAAAPAPTTPTN